MKRYISSASSAEFSGDKHLDRYITKLQRIVNLELPSEYVTNADWDMEDDKVILNLIFANGDEHLFTFDTWRFTKLEGYINEDADIILKTVENYIRNTIDPFLTEVDGSTWELKEYKSVRDYDGFYTDYTLWYSPVENLWVCIFGDRDIYTPENSDYDAEFETKREAYEWFEDYTGFEDDDEDWVEEGVESSTDLSKKFIDVHDKDDDTDEMTATDIVTWMYRTFNDYEFYDERSLDDERVRLMFEVGKKSSRDLVEDALDSKHIDYKFSRIGNRLFIDAVDDYEVEYVGESCDVKSSEDEFVDMETGLNYWYFTTHGVQPGSVPRGLNIIKVVDTPSGTYFLTDRVLTTKSLKYYDIKEKAPKNFSSSSIKADFDPIEDMDATGAIGKLNTGDKFKNRNGVVVTILEPTKDGKVQFSIGDEVRTGSEKSIQKLLYRNNYIRAKIDYNYDNRHFTRVRSYDWKEFLSEVEEATGMKIDAAYKRRHRGDDWLKLYSDDGREFDTEFTQYSDGEYEFLSYHLIEVTRP